MCIMELTAKIIAEYLGGVIEGNPEVTVSAFAKIESAPAGTITFLANPKYEHYIYTTGASIVLVNSDFKAEKSIGATLIRVPDSYAALSRLLSLAASYLKPKHGGVEKEAHIADDVEIPSDCYIGAFAYIAPGVKLGHNVKIYPQAYIGEGVEIGDDTTIYAGVKIYYGCRIGKRCIIHAGAVIGADGFGFAPDKNGAYHKIEQIGIVQIDDDVEIGANTTIDRATMGITHVCAGVKLDNLVQVAHNVVVGHDTVMCAQVGIAGSTKVGANCMLGGQVGVAGHITIGDRVQLGAQSGVPNSIAPDQRLLGSPPVPGSAFARSVVYTKRLGELFDKVARLEKELSNLRNEQR